jgi:hypothetical protein
MRNSITIGLHIEKMTTLKEVVDVGTQKTKNRNVYYSVLNFHGALKG